MPDTPLRKIREAMGVTQSEVATAIGVDQSTFCKVEQGAGCTRDTAERIVGFFGEPLTELHVMYPSRYTRFMERAK